MKIGITTFNWANNYGAMLQAYALQSFLCARGHTVEIVRYCVGLPPAGLRKWIARTLYGCVSKWEVTYKEYIFEQFRQRYLMRTPEVFRSINDLKNIADRFDMLITGSDQVWNPSLLAQVDHLDDLYFLSFAGTRTRRISYAASFGCSEKGMMNEEWQNIISQKLQNMDRISVREESGLDVIQSLGVSTNAVHVVDPTLLLGKMDYEKMVGRGKTSRDFLFSYMLHGMEQDAESLCGQISETLKLKRLKCDARKTAVHKGYTLPSPIGWLQQIRDASFMVTNSFHGVAFCLIFHIPFIAVLLGGDISSMNARVVDLLKAVGLTDRIILPQHNTPAEFFNKEINWCNVDQQISSMRAKSVNFLARETV